MFVLDEGHIKIVIRHDVKILGKVPLSTALLPNFSAFCLSPELADKKKWPTKNSVLQCWWQGPENIVKISPKSRTAVLSKLNNVFIFLRVQFEGDSFSLIKLARMAESSVKDLSLAMRGNS